MRKPTTIAPTHPNSISCRCQASGSKAVRNSATPAKARSQRSSAITAQEVPPTKKRRNSPRSNAGAARSEEHTSELQSLMRISYAVFCLKKQKKTKLRHQREHKTNNN